MSPIEIKKSLEQYNQQQTPYFKKELERYHEINDPTYREEVRKSLIQACSPPPPCYEVVSSKIAKRSKTLFHRSAGQLLVPATNSPLMRIAGRGASTWRRSAGEFLLRNTSQNYRVKRFSIALNKTVIDAVVLSHSQALKTNRWILYTGGNGETWEDTLYRDLRYPRFSLSSLAKKLDAGIVCFNLPGVGQSKYPGASRTAMAATHSAMLDFLTSPWGLGATTVLAIGFSNGGGVQAESLAEYTPRPNVQLLAVEAMTYASLRNAAKDLVTKKLKGGKIARRVGDTVAVFIENRGWNVSTAEAVNRIEFPVLVLQAGQGCVITSDGVISGKDSLARHVQRRENVTIKKIRQAGHFNWMRKGGKELIEEWFRATHMEQTDH